MLHVKLSVRKTDVIPATKTAIGKSKLILNKNNSRIQDEVEEQEQTDEWQSEGLGWQAGMESNALEFIY